MGPAISLPNGPDDRTEPTADEDPDALLVELARQAPSGDTRHFEALVKKHQSKVVANCRYITRAPADAEDLAQEVFVKVFFALSRFEQRSKFSTWLQRIKINHCLNHLRKGEGKTFVDVEDPAVARDPSLHVEPTAERRISAADDRGRIDAALDALTDTLRIPLIMRDADELSYDEIAQTLGIGLSAVKMRIKRGREEFRRLFENPSTTTKPDVDSETAGR